VDIIITAAATAILMATAVTQDQKPTRNLRNGRNLMTLLQVRPGDTAPRRIPCSK
jgi:hypothetical protein